jgi:hypothetical protein
LDGTKVRVGESIARVISVADLGRMFLTVAGIVWYKMLKNIVNVLLF